MVRNLLVRICVLKHNNSKIFFRSIYFDLSIYIKFSNNLFIFIDIIEMVDIEDDNKMSNI